MKPSPNAESPRPVMTPTSAHSCAVKAGFRAEIFSVPRRLRLRKHRHGTKPFCQSLQPPAYKDLVEQKFEARCANYDQKGNYHYKVAAELVSRAGLQPGWNVLDVACGTGLATFLAASEVGQTGSVTGVDLSSGMVEKDAENAALQSNSFDAILSSSGMPYLDTKIMSKKFHAWLKPGGLLIYNTPEAPYSPLLTLMHQLLKGAGHKTCASPFPWLKDELKILEAAGFHDIKVERTSEYLLGEAVPLDVYVRRGWQLVGFGLEPFFPCLLGMSKTDKDTLNGVFGREATEIGKSLLNANNLVEDKHDSCTVLAYASAA